MTQRMNIFKPHLRETAAKSPRNMEQEQNALREQNQKRLHQKTPEIHFKNITQSATHPIISHPTEENINLTSTEELLLASKDVRQVRHELKEGVPFNERVNKKKTSTVQQVIQVNHVTQMNQNIYQSGAGDQMSASANGIFSQSPRVKRALNGAQSPKRPESNYIQKVTGNEVKASSRLIRDDNFSVANSQKQMPGSQAGGYQMLRRASQNNINMMEEANGRFNRQRNQLMSRLESCELEKKEIYRRNIQMQENQFRMQRESQILKAKCAQLENDVRSNQDIIERITIQAGKFKKQEEILVQEMQNKYADIVQKMKAQSTECDLFKRKCEELRIYAERNEQKSKTMQFSSNKQVYQLKKLEDFQRHELARVKEIYQQRIMQLQNALRERPKSRDGERREEANALKREIESRDRFIQKLKSQLEGLELEAHKNVDLGMKLANKEQEIVKMHKEWQRMADLLNIEHTNINSLEHEYGQKLNAVEGSYRITEEELNRLRESRRQKELIEFSKHFMYEGLKRQQGERNMDRQEIVRGQGENSFSQLLQQHSLQVNQLRTELSDKMQEIFKLRGEIETLKNQVSQIEQQANLKKLMLNANVNSLTSAKSSVEAVLKSQIEASKRKIGSLETRCHILEDEIREKDDFIRGHLLNKKEDSGVLLNRLQMILQRR